MDGRGVIDVAQGLGKDEYEPYRDDAQSDQQQVNSAQLERARRRRVRARIRTIEGHGCSRHLDEPKGTDSAVSNQRATNSRAESMVGVVRTLLDVHREPDQQVVELRFL